jgi:hypothetical protein
VVLAGSDGKPGRCATASLDSHNNTARRGVLMATIKGATLKVIKGAPHGMCSTEKDQINADLLSFFKG